MYELRKQVSITAADYVEFNKSHHSKPKKMLVPILVWAFILLFTTLVYIAVFTREHKYSGIPYFTFMFFFILAFTTAAIWAAYFLLKYIGVGLRLLFYHMSYESRVRFKEGEITINNVGVEIRDEVVRRFAVWDQIVRIVDGRSAFYFYHTQNAAFIFPKRYLESLDELHYLKELIREAQLRRIATDYR